MAQSDEGPRGKSTLSATERDKYSNLILLCRNHHKIVDDQVSAYSVERLHEMKDAHETWVRESLGGFDAGEQRDKELYASYVDEFVARSDLNGWRGWISGLFSAGHQHIEKQRFEALTDLRNWIFTRVWPHRMTELEDAFANFRLVLQDLQLVFGKHSEDFGGNLGTKKFYQIERWDPPRYERLSSEYDFHTELVEDLALELTRAANYVCDLVRRRLDWNFRLAEGVLTVESGMYMDFTYHYFRPEYRSGERTSAPYPGLSKFKKVRSTRDLHMGTGDGPSGKGQDTGGSR